MVSGHLSEKKGIYYTVLSYQTSDGKRKSKWESTGLPVKGNKKRAERILLERRSSFVPPEPKEDESVSEDVLFTDYLEHWLSIAKPTVQLTTYASYQSMITNLIIPYFKNKNLMLKDVKPTHIQDFYTEQLKRVKSNSVIHYHSVIHRALKYAVRIELIPSNPADKVERPKKNTFKGGFYTAEEINTLIGSVSGTKLELPVMFGAFYGLRRSEVVGLKWDAIDFEKNTIEIKHIVTSCHVDGAKVLVQADRTKTKSSNRTLPLVPIFREKLLLAKQKQSYYKKLCGRSYCKEYLDYICVDELGNLIKPNYITEEFKKHLAHNGFRRIRFHDLRHSCASLLLANGVPMKQIQEWLGHSDFSTTANIYSHLDFSSKLTSADAMQRSLGLILPDTEQECG